ncbi:MAG: TIR domain-containing protein [Bacteroidota bacterium]
MDITEVFVTEGLPKFTYVEPPNYNEILVDVKKVGKPVIIEGQSGTGKTSTILKILSDIKDETPFTYFSARKREDLINIVKLINEPRGGNFVIDDFHRLVDNFKISLSNIAKIAADEGSNSNYPKLVIIGINQTGSELLNLSPDIAKRCGIHKIKPGSEAVIMNIIERGERLLNIKFLRPKAIYSESKGDYWLTQLLCQTFCLQNNVLKTQENPKIVSSNIKDIRKSIIDRLENSYNLIVKEFCRGKRFRPSNNGYIRFLQAISKINDFPIDLNELVANVEDPFKVAINSLKDHRLNVHIKEKAILNSNFYYSPDTKLFNVEDPALQYYIKHIDWKKMTKECGFSKSNGSHTFDIAISFAGENRELAEEIALILRMLDFEVFYDRLYEDNYLGSSWGKEFERIFTNDSKFVVCILDEHHRRKIWPTFERECFSEKIQTNEVIPIFLDDTKFVGIPQDLIGIRFKYNKNDKTIAERIRKEIVYKIAHRVQ